MKEFGNTYKEIKNEGFKIFKKVELSKLISNKNYISKSVGWGSLNFQIFLKK